MIVIIPSRTVLNLGPCAAAVRKNEPGAQILVVDDGVDWAAWDLEKWGPRPVAIPGAKPFIFARNVNEGVRFILRNEMSSHGIFATRGLVVLNDDALLVHDRGFSLLEREALSHPDLAAVAATTNFGHRNQKPLGAGLRYVDHCAYVAIYFKRTAWEEIGELDERFVAYGYEDNDYSLRIARAGQRLAVHDLCYVDHGLLRSTFRGDPKTPADLQAGRAIFTEKWKHLPDYKKWL